MVEDFLRPRKLIEALKYRKEYSAIPFAGGTDLVVQHRGYSSTGIRFERPVLYLDQVDALKRIMIEKDTITIGAAVTLTEILDHPDIPEVLHLAAADVAAVGIRNRATIGGNICNASPAADTIPALAVLDAELLIVSENTERRLPILNFLQGPGKTELKNYEILAAVIFPRPPLNAVHYWRKIGTRKANALSKVATAGYAEIDQDMLKQVRFALGAVAPTVIRLPEVERQLLEGEPQKYLLEMAAHFIRPINDQRSTAQYRKQVALNCFEEFLTTLGVAYD
jgi:xanthine dehydrogenase FAD-binding subunit